ncbi:riboflavin biosynthesis protein RibF [Companilactobacillus sp. RD055328]|uniref:riboflavin biosynthesis protein RibF n=1 Tax=Companilactobacillus sp. RD055328 TaxID=2916634 RepID=UPI001FC8D159|nr:riboflavin biosynthesis protein RibF [Companilactobacillus sp. RD055328]
MEMIELNYPIDRNKIPNDEIVLALGFFDGVHVGHQQVINTAKKIADKNSQKLAVMTFNQSPVTIFGDQSEETFRYLSTIERKSELFEQLGVDYMYVAMFSDKFNQLLPQEFVDQYIVRLNAKTVVAGFDYTYGKKDIANMTRLHDYAKSRFNVVEVPEIKFNEKKLGSTSIKKALESKDINEANEQLGYDYENSGVVIHGLQRGRTLGFPTANVEVDQKEFIPGIGIYITEIKIDGKWYPSMTSVGYNITFDDIKDLTIESNILNFNQDVYGKNVKIKWLKYLRDEVKFDDVDGLIKQLNQDKINTEKYFKFYK